MTGPVPLKANWVINDDFTAENQNEVSGRINQHSTAIAALETGGGGGGGGGTGDVTVAGTQTLIHKTMSGADNTFLNISADSVVDGTTNRVFTAADEAKLATLTPGGGGGGTGGSVLVKNSEGFYVPTAIPDVVVSGGGGGGGGIAAPVSITGSRIVDYGFCQSNFGHESWTGFGETTLREVLAGMKLMGAKRLRMAAWWGRFEPTTRGAYDWDGLDRGLDLCEEYGIVPLVVITGGGQSPVYSTPTITDFANACGALAARYGNEGTGQLQHYEIWNEPNHAPGFYDPFSASFGAAHYTSLLIAASSAIRNADSEAFILSAGLMSTADFSTTDIAPHTFLTGIYNNGGRNYFDACSHHWYSHTPDFTTWQEPSATQYFYTEMLDTRAVMVAHGDAAKDMWVTEFGFSRTTLTDPVQRADWLAKQIELIAQHDWASPFFIYNYREDGPDSSNFEYTFGATSYGGSEHQPYWNTAASINSTVKQGTATSTVVSGGGGGSGSGSGTVTLGELFQPMTGVWPAVDATNGPVTADTGIVAGSPSTSGRALYTPSTAPAVFNVQSQQLQSFANGVAGNASGSTVWLNHSTPRHHGFGDRNGHPYESNIDLGFMTDSTSVTIAYYHYNLYTVSNYHDHQIYAQYEGAMRKFSRLPRTSTGGGGLFYRTITFLESREREFRVMLPMNCWFIGVYVNTQATMRKSPNKPLLLINGDSWNEPAGDTLQAPNGGAWSAGGSYRTYYLPNAIAEQTGFAVGLVAQGGTGYFQANNGVLTSETFVDATGDSTFMSVHRVADMATKFFPRNPILWTIGSWNDGALGGTPYRDTYEARVTSGINRCVAAKTDLALMFSTIQPAASFGTFYDDFRVQSTLGLIDASEASANSIGCVNIEPMCKDMSMAGQRGANVGPDSLHLHAKGSELVAGWMLADASRFRVDRSYIDTALALDVPTAGTGP